MLAWYDKNRRILPWRAAPKVLRDPYRIWISEIMLQQTTVATVGPYFSRFIKKFPTLETLATAPIDDVRRLWAGLGYYRRAHLLHACAQTLVTDWGSLFPKTEKELLTLPGFGAYTAAAVAAIAFDRRANVVDGNVERIMARLFNEKTPLPQSKKKLKAFAETLLPTKRYGDYAQSLMDLGATICTPKNPSCARCPIASSCAALKSGEPEELPRRAPKAQKPRKKTIAFVLRTADAVFLRQRPAHGLLASMTEVPTCAWDQSIPPLPDAATTAGFPSSIHWKILKTPIRHTFTHFELELRVAIATIAKKPVALKGRWIALKKLGDEALPSVMRKVLEKAL